MDHTKHPMFGSGCCRVYAIKKTYSYILEDEIFICSMPSADQFNRYSRLVTPTNLNGRMFCGDCTRSYPYAKKKAYVRIFSFSKKTTSKAVLGMS